MLEKTTTELDKILEKTKPDSMDAYYRENRGSMADGKAFYYYMKDTLEKSGFEKLSADE